MWKPELKGWAEPAGSCYFQASDADREAEKDDLQRGGGAHREAAKRDHEAPEGEKLNSFSVIFEYPPHPVISTSPGGLVYQAKQALQSLNGFI